MVKMIFSTNRVKVSINPSFLGGTVYKDLLIETPHHLVDHFTLDVENSFCSHKYISILISQYPIDEKRPFHSHCFLVGLCHDDILLPKQGL